ncbi:hypothetical protein F4823DRAFT_640405 [Ustulina deusta]|nr:hypothetical protein F4823DRAFT_640405 [Ustulina deusta]
MKARTVYLLVLGDFWAFATASFHTNFNDIRRHTDLLLEWDLADAIDYPLVIHVRVLNTSSDHKVNTFDTDISTGLTEGSFLWNDLPSPLPFLSTATYELQVLRQQRAGDIMSDLVITSSTPFTIGDDNNSGWQTTINETASDSPESANSSHSDGRPNSSTAIAAGLVVPLVVGISVFVFLRMQRRRKRTLEERRKEREVLVIN